MAADRTHYADEATLARLAQLERLEAGVIAHNKHLDFACRTLKPVLKCVGECTDCPRQYIIEVPK